LSKKNIDSSNPQFSNYLVSVINRSFRSISISKSDRSVCEVVLFNFNYSNGVKLIGLLDGVNN
ncbi:TPA: hypothetical protein ACV7WC_004400, partial [Escherichia coli]